MKILEKKCWAYWFVLLLIMLFMTSCKSRQMSKSETKSNIEGSVKAAENEKLEDKTKESDKTEQAKEGTKESKEETKTSGYRITPIDKDKPVIIKDADGKETAISNAIVESLDTETKKETKETLKETQSSNRQKQYDIVKETGSSFQGEIKANSEATNKNVKSEPVSIWSFWWLLLLLLAIPVLLIGYKKLKKSGWMTALKNKLR